MAEGRRQAAEGKGCLIFNGRRQEAGGRRQKGRVV